MTLKSFIYKALSVPFVYGAYFFLTDGEWISVLLGSSFLLIAFCFAFNYILLGKTVLALLGIAAIGVCFMIDSIWASVFYSVVALACILPFALSFVPSPKPGTYKVTSVRSSNVRAVHADLPSGVYHGYGHLAGDLAHPNPEQFTLYDIHNIPLEMRDGEFVHV